MSTQPDSQPDDERDDALPDAQLHGMDPGELIARAMKTAQLTGGMHGWTPPTVEELARMLPQYRIERLLGQGGMGAVYLGYQEKLDRSVALKVLPAELATDAGFVSRFEREARMLARLQHPGIVAVYDFGQTPEGHFYFVMEYVEGTDLRRVLQGPGLDAEQSLEVVCQICEALQAAHEQGVIHRDVKPANILISTDGRVKLVDFGLALPAQGETDPLTHSHVVMGTPDYMAPEQRQGRPDHRSDIFALGITLYEMLTGQPPRGAFVAPSHKVAVDARIDEVVQRALQEVPDQRYQQASEMKTDVDIIRSGTAENPSTLPSDPVSVQRPYRTTLMIALPVLAIAALAAAVFLGSQPPTSPSLSTAPALATPTPDPTPASVQIPASVPASPGSVERALTTAVWRYKTPYTNELYVFLPDHTVRMVDGSPTDRTWSVNGPNSFVLHIPKGSSVMTFNEDFTAFTGKPIRRRGQAFGTRIMTTQNGDGSTGGEDVAVSTPPAVPAAVPPTASAAEPTPAKSHLDTLAESGALITDQVLAPLGALSVPESLVTGWIENLRDEAATAPATSQPAYRAGIQLLLAWKGAIAERTKILASSSMGGRIVDTANKDASRQATLTMWDWLMYARERNDAAAHEVRASRTTEFFASGPPKVWADRAAALRPGIERLFAGFRQLRRQSLPTTNPPVPPQS